MSLLKKNAAIFGLVFIFLMDFFYCTGQTTISDIDGNIYNTVTIGNQIWMKENLKTTRYNTGEPILLVTNDTAWSVVTTGYYSYYDNDYINYGSIYGALYNWYAVNNNHILCPSNWHVPSNSDWNILEKYLDSSVDTTIEGNTGTDIGYKLKETGNLHWNYSDSNITNSSNFTALGGGYRNYIYGWYTSQGEYGYWWTSSSISDQWARCKILSRNNSGILNYGAEKRTGLSVRCIKDVSTIVTHEKYSDKINIFPNPFLDKIKIEGLNDGRIVIFNLNGQIEKIINISKHSSLIDLSELYSGVYTIKIIFGNDLIVKKIIKL